MGRPEEAEAIAMAIECGAVALGDIIEWAVSQIADEERPSSALIELATLGRNHPLDAVGHLRDLSSDSDRTFALGLLAQLIDRAFRRDPSRIDAIVRTLYVPTAAILLGSELSELACHADDELTLAADGILGATYEAAVANVREDFRRLAEKAQRSGHLWSPPFDV